MFLQRCLRIVRVIDVFAKCTDIYDLNLFVSGVLRSASQPQADIERIRRVGGAFQPELSALKRPYNAAISPTVRTGN
jgi:hypothetical protein